MQKNTHILFWVGVLIVIGLVFLGNQAEEVKANSTDHNVSGWAWSDTIGWVSFNNSTDESGVDYGVNIDWDNGKNMEGYAWSDNIGWIDFDPPGPYPSDSGDCMWNGTHAKLKNNGDGTYTVVGWARATRGADNNGGWDGWICMSIDTSPVVLGADNKFTGYSWGGGGGDGVIGWLQWNPPGGGVVYAGELPSEGPSLEVGKIGEGNGRIVSLGSAHQGHIDCGDDCIDDEHSNPFDLRIKMDSVDPNSEFDGWYADSSGTVEYICAREETPQGCEGPFPTNELVCKTCNIAGPITIYAKFSSTESPPETQCADEDGSGNPLDNDDPEDDLANASDPGCWADPFVSGSYDSSDDSEVDPYALRVIPSTGGSVDDTGISGCTTSAPRENCEEIYDAVTDVTLTATPNNGYKFDRWADEDEDTGSAPNDCSGPVCTISVTKVKNIRAYFEVEGGDPPPANEGCPYDGPEDCPACNDGVDNDGDFDRSGGIDWNGCDHTYFDPELGARRCDYSDEASGPPAGKDPFCLNENMGRESFNSDFIET